MEKNSLDRLSESKKYADSYGRLSPELRKAVGMLILKGTLGTDKGIGGCPRIAGRGSHVVNYIAVTPNSFDHIEWFQVNKNFIASDHLPR